MIGVCKGHERIKFWKTNGLKSKLLVSARYVYIYIIFSINLLGHTSIPILINALRHIDHVQGKSIEWLDGNISDTLKQLKMGGGHWKREKEKKVIHRSNWRNQTWTDMNVPYIIASVKSLLQNLLITVKAKTNICDCQNAKGRGGGGDYRGQFSQQPL